MSVFLICLTQEHRQVEDTVASSAISLISDSSKAATPYGMDAVTGIILKEYMQCCNTVSTQR